MGVLRCKGPQEVEVDNSPALQLPLAKTFCLCQDFANLRDRCFCYLTGITLEFPYLWYLRLDVAHILSSAKKWKLSTEFFLRRLKQFYLSCLGLLVEATWALNLWIQGFYTAIILIFKDPFLEITQEYSISLILKTGELTCQFPFIKMEIPPLLLVLPLPVPMLLTLWKSQKPGML